MLVHWVEVSDMHYAVQPRTVESHSNKSLLLSNMQGIGFKTMSFQRCDKSYVI